MKKISILTLVLFGALQTFAQQEVKLTINHLLGSSEFAFNAETENDLGDKFKLSRLEYYISGISIVHDGGQVSSASDIYILVRANQNDTITLGDFNLTTIESINFSVGVDPGVNNADPTKWASSHPLSPKSPSMHWGWASGYRFVALEGKSGQNFSQDFQIHALGNKNYFKQNIPVSAVEAGQSMVIALNADYTLATSEIGMSDGLIEHSENNEAATCLRNFQTKVFSNLDGEGNTLSQKDVVVEEAFQIYPNPSLGKVTLSLGDMRFQSGSISVINTLGEIVLDLSVKGFNQEFSMAQPGVYFVRISKDNLVSTKTIIVQ